MGSLSLRITVLARYTFLTLKFHSEIGMLEPNREVGSPILLSVSSRSVHNIFRLPATTINWPAAAVAVVAGTPETNLKMTNEPECSSNAPEILDDALSVEANC